MISSTDLVIQLANISKSFAGVHALKGVSFDLRAGEVHALVGENGAGKSTLIKIITGAVQPDAGSLEILGQRIQDNSPARSRSFGVAAIYQQPALFPDLTVAENIAIGLESNHPWKRVRWADRRARASALLAQVGSKIDPDREAGQLSMPEQQLVEIAKALGSKAKVLIMDEPTSSLSENEVANLFRVIGELKSQGAGIIYISHRLDELPQIADRVTALRDGALVGTKLMSETSTNELIKMMVGRELSAIFPKIEAPIGNRVLEVSNLSCRASGIRNISFYVRSGEILGLAGLVGAGRTDLARVLFGLTPADSGTIQIRGKTQSIKTPAEAAALGIAYVPEDRRRHGVILDMPVAANASMAILDRITGFANRLDSKQEQTIAQGFVDRLGIKTPTVSQIAGNLSGGNQQKVALARWLAANPSILILDEPTQGVDVGAKSEIHRLMSELASKGMAIVMISSELPEILGMSDRIAVMRSGAIVGTMDRSQATQEAILELELGHGAMTMAEERKAS